MEIAIIGGGITGLSTALALQKMGLSCQVYERAPRLEAAGAGIWMQPNAMQILDWLGVGEAVRSKGIPLREVELTDRKLKSFRGNQHSLELKGADQRIISIHRARLQQALYDALPAGSVCLGKEYTHHVADNGKVYIHFAEGTVESDLLLAADGIHSRVRQALFPQAQTRYSGQTCWRGIAPLSLEAPLRQAGKEAWGNRIRFGFAPVTEEEVYWFAVGNAPLGQQDERAHLKEDLLYRFRDFHPVIHDLIEKTPIEKIIRNDISDLRRLDRWHQGPACLLGDAAHATTPNMGQGGCQGVEDAYYISKFLNDSLYATQAFQVFENFRRKKVDYVVNNSWRFGQMAHNPVGQKVMITLMRLTPERVLKKQMETLFTVPGLT